MKTMQLWLSLCAMTVCHTVIAEFTATHYRFNRTIENLDDVWSCMADTSSWAAKPVTKVYGAFAFKSQISDAGLRSDFAVFPLPGFQKQTDHCDNMAVQAHAIVDIPSAGFWSFDCGHDDGFIVTISGCGQVYSFQDERNTSYTHTTRAYHIAVPGTYAISILGYEVCGGMIFDFSVAKGEHRRFDGRLFKLVGTAESEVVFAMNSQKESGETTCRAESAESQPDAGELWRAVPLPAHDGYTWTLTSRIGDMLKNAEKLFGPRDMSWTILGAEIRKDDTNPQNWHPGHPERKDIIFQLAPSAAKGACFAYYQLAHEVVHALAPDVGKGATVLEEGVATWFAKWYVKRALGEDMNAGVGDYQNAECAVGKLLDSDPEAIRKLRAVQPCFKEMTPSTFEKAGIVATASEIRILLSPFGGR